MKKLNYQIFSICPKYLKSIVSKYYSPEEFENTYSLLFDIYLLDANKTPQFIKKQNPLFERIPDSDLLLNLTNFMFLPLNKTIREELQSFFTINDKRIDSIIAVAYIALMRDKPDIRKKDDSIFKNDSIDIDLWLYNIRQTVKEEIDIQKKSN